MSKAVLFYLGLVGTGGPLSHSQNDWLAVRLSSLGTSRLVLEVANNLASTLAAHGLHRATLASTGP